MFKVGDDVVCISPKMSGYYKSELYNIYKVDHVCPNEYFYGYDIKDKSSYRLSSLLEYRHFVPLTEYRKMKINKICSKLGTK